MERFEKTRELLLEHYRRYPKLKLQDLFKYLYQSAFGCEHFAPATDVATDRIREEYNRYDKRDGALIEPLDGDYSRVNLSYLRCGLSAEVLGKIFCASAKSEPHGKEKLESRLDALRKLVDENELPFSKDELENAASEWKAAGYPSLHHSDVFRECYKPAYRVVSNRFVPFLPVLAEIDKRLKEGRLTVAIEGSSASGKSTLADMLKGIYGCTVFHMDDFFLRPEQRTEQRYAEVGGNVDRERFLSEVLIPLSEGRAVDYRKFNCSEMALEPAIKIIPDKLTVVEGAYSMHPDLAGYYGLAVFLDVDREVQKKRISKRNTPKMAERFFNEWIPLEKIYFSEMLIKERCDISVAIAE